MGIDIGGIVSGARDWAGDRLDDVEHAKDWVGDKIEGGVQAAEDGIDGFRDDLVDFGEQRGGIVGKTLAQGISDDIGVLEGGTLAVYDMGKGLVQLADGVGKLTNPVEWAIHGDRNLQRLETAGRAVETIGNLTSPVAWATDPGGNARTAEALWNGVTAGYQDAARDGDWSKFAGRAVVDVGSLFIGAGEANAALKGAEGASVVARVGETGEALNVVDKAADGARVADELGELGRIGRPGEVGRGAATGEDLADILARADTGTRVGGRPLLHFDSMDTFDLAANAARPDTVYAFGNYRWTTDGEGRVIRAEGQVSLDPVGRNDPKLQTQIGHEGYHTDVGFHLIADSFGGPTNRLNVVPGNGKPLPDGTRNLNTGAYGHQFEGQIRALKREHPDLKIEMRVEPQYDAGNHSNRPDEFIAAYRAEGGKWIEYEFDNIH